MVDTHQAAQRRQPREATDSHWVTERALDTKKSLFRPHLPRGKHNKTPQRKNKACQKRNKTARRKHTYWRMHAWCHTEGFLAFDFCRFCVFISSPPQRSMTVDFKGFLFLIHYIIFLSYFLRKGQYFPFQCWVLNKWTNCRNQNVENQESARTNDMIFHLGHSAKKAILALWKDATKFRIYKKGKYKKYPSSYSLLSCLLKRNINTRLMAHLDANNVLSPTQNGYRKQRTN